MINDFQNVFDTSLTLSQLVMNLTVALICGLLIAVFYKKTYKGAGYANSFLNTLIVLSIITAIVMMVIGNNLARAFGLVGAMSIVRFRTAVKEPFDIVYIFFSLAVGMAAGVGFLSIAILGTLFVGIVLILLSKTSIIHSEKKEYLLQFYYSGNGNGKETPYLYPMQRYCKDYKLINIKSGVNGEGMELSYYIKLRNMNRNTDFISELKNINGLKHVNLFFDEESI